MPASNRCSGLAGVWKRMKKHSAAIDLLGKLKTKTKKVSPCCSGLFHSVIVVEAWLGMTIWYCKQTNEQTNKQTKQTNKTKQNKQTKRQCLPNNSFRMQPFKWLAASSTAWPWKDEYISKSLHHSNMSQGHLGRVHLLNYQYLETPELLNMTWWNHTPHDPTGQGPERIQESRQFFAPRQGVSLERHHAAYRFL